MSAIKLPDDYFDWNKTRDLVKLLGKGAEVLPLRLWCYCGRHPEERGRLAANLAYQVESIVVWWGEKGKAVLGLKECLFLMDVGDGLLLVDWPKVGGHILGNRARSLKANESRWSDPSRTPWRSPPSIPSSNPSSMAGVDVAPFHRRAGPLGPPVNVNSRRTA